MTQEDRLSRLERRLEEVERKQIPRKADLDHLKWSVTKRAEIEASLYALYGYVRHNPPQQLHTSMVLDHSIAAAFSLWRAVFLADKVRTPHSNHQAQENFLEKVVTTNAINFPDDQRNSAWTVSFYLENAKYRLRDGAVVASEFLDFQDRDPTMLLLQLKGTGEIRHTRYEWECIHLALAKIFNVIAPSAFVLPLVNPTSQQDASLFSDSE